MSKVIRPTKQDIEKLKQEFLKELMSGKWENGKVNFQATLGKIDRDAKLIFTNIAWRKMQALVQGFNSEVGWHGIARRGDDDEYYIDDVLVYPQEVTGATVTTDQVEYQTWLADHQLESNNMIRMQGHSHVNMGTTPSGTDWALYRSILDDLSDESFYILLIWNKSNQKTIMIYDMKKNILFETTDVTVEVEDDGGFEAFCKEAKRLVKNKPTTTYNYNPTTTYNYNQKTKPNKPVVQTQIEEDDYCGYARRVWHD